LYQSISSLLEKVFFIHVYPVLVYLPSYHPLNKAFCFCFLEIFDARALFHTHFGNEIEDEDHHV
jgi:hypothetical protein